MYNAQVQLTIVVIRSTKQNSLFGILYTKIEDYKTLLALRGKWLILGGDINAMRVDWESRLTISKGSEFTRFTRFLYYHQCVIKCFEIEEHFDLKFDQSAVLLTLSERIKVWSINQKI